MNTFTYNYDDCGNLKNILNTSFPANFQFLCQPKNKVVTTGELISFSVSVNDPFSLTGYQWYKNGIAMGKRGDSLLFQSVNTDDEGDYSVVATAQNVLEPITSNPAHLWVSNPLPKDCVLWLKGEGNVDDEMGNVNAIATNGLTYFPGIVGQAFNINNSSAGIRITGGANSILDVGEGNGFTIECWIKTTSLNVKQAVLGWGQDIGSNGVRLFINWGNNSQVNGNVYAAIDTHNGSSDVNILYSAPGSLTLNAWHHVAVSYNQSTSEAILYLDGEIVATSNSFNNADKPNTIGDFFIGYNAGYKFMGLIDEPAIYKRALAPKEILSIFQAGAIGKNNLQPYFITDNILPPAVQNSTYSVHIQVIFGTGQITFSLRPGSVLPPQDSPPNPTPNMILESSSGILSGTPSEVGTYNFIIRATDSTGYYKDQLFTLQVTRI